MKLKTSLSFICMQDNKGLNLSECLMIRAEWPPEKQFLINIDKLKLVNTPTILILPEEYHFFGKRSPSFPRRTSRTNDQQKR